MSAPDSRAKGKGQRGKNMITGILAMEVCNQAPAQELHESESHADIICLLSKSTGKKGKRRGKPEIPLLKAVMCPSASSLEPENWKFQRCKSTQGHI